MLLELEPVWKQLAETYDALMVALDEIPDDRLDWQPASQATTISEISQHIARANTTYANMMESGERGARAEIQPHLSREAILERIQMSLDHARRVFEALPIDRLRAPCADGWEPIGAPVAGPLDALWFAHVMVTHTAYHVGQINYISRLLGK